MCQSFFASLDITFSLNSSSKVIWYLLETDVDPPNLTSKHLQFQLQMTLVHCIPFQRILSRQQRPQLSLTKAILEVAAYVR